MFFTRGLACARHKLTRKDSMKTVNNFEFKQRKYIPVFPKAAGKPTVYIEGYPYEDDEPMGRDRCFTVSRLPSFSINSTGISKSMTIFTLALTTSSTTGRGDLTKCLSPDVYVVFGVRKVPQRRSFYTWAEGAAPAAVFEFLSDATAHQDRKEKVERYLIEMGVQEYFIHQPELKKSPAEFRGGGDGMLWGKSLRWSRMQKVVYSVKR